MSVSEKAFWSFVESKKLGFKFRTQHPVSNYFLDFYCPEAALCVEIDGPQHLERQEKDVERDKKLAELGVLTIRIPTEDLWGADTVVVHRWIELVQKTCEERAGRVAFPDREE